MDAVEYLKEKARMTDKCGICCSKCLLYKGGCLEADINYPEQAVAIVEQWAKGHPVKTYLSVLLEKFPKAEINGNKTPGFCPHNIFGESVKFEEYDNCDIGSVGLCLKCWNREYKEEP